MNQEERIQALEAEVNYLRQSMGAMRDVLSWHGGRQSTVEAAVMALLQATPPNALLNEVLATNLLKDEAWALAEILSEQYITGLQQAQELIVACCQESQRLYAPAEDGEGDYGDR